MVAPDGDSPRAAPPPGTAGSASPSAVLHVRFRSVLALVASIGAAILVRNVVDKATRVLGWLAAAIVVAALLEPVADALARHMRRIFAVLLVVLVVLGSVGGLVYAVIDDIRTETHRLQRVLPEAAAEIESSPRYGRAARDFGLRDRVQAFVDELPDRLAGGDTAEVVRANATRGAAFLAGGVLTLFLMSYGPRAVHAALDQVSDTRRRRRLYLVLGRAYQRTWRYLVGSLAVAVLSGIYAYVWFRLAALPGSGVLAIVVGVVSVLPLVGIFVGAMPAVLLAVGVTTGVWPSVLVLAFVAAQLVEAKVLRPWVHHGSIAVGPAVTLLVSLMGLALYGFGGAIVGLCWAVFAVAVFDELAPTDEHELDLGVLTEPT